MGVMHLLHGMLDGARVSLWVLLDLVVLAVAIGVASDIRASLRRRHKRIAAERATWAESVTKQTKPPPMAQDSTISIPLVVTYEDCSPGRRKAEAKALVDRALGIPSPTAPASARKVRAATKRRK